MKSFQLKKVSVFLGLLLIFGFFSSQALAAGAWDAQIGAQGNNNIGSWFGQSSGTPDIRMTVFNLINLALSFLAIIFLVLTVVAGFLWLTSSGDAKKVETAQGYLKNAIIGLVIILAAKALTIFLIARFVNATVGSTAIQL